MATPDHIGEIFEAPQVTVEVAGDYVHLTLVSRFGEPILMLLMSADEADAVAAKLCDAVAVIDTRNGQVAEAADFDDALGQVTGLDPAMRPWPGKAEAPNPTFSEAVDALFDGAAPKPAASA